MPWWRAPAPSAYPCRQLSVCPDLSALAQPCPPVSTWEALKLGTNGCQYGVQKALSALALQRLIVKDAWEPVLAHPDPSHGPHHCC